jgi:cytochrome c556
VISWKPPTRHYRDGAEEQRVEERIMTIKMKWVSASFLCLGLAASAVMAQDSPVKVREQMMKQVAASTAAMRDIAKGDKPYDAAVVEKSLTTISTNLKAFPDQFPPGTAEGSEASPKIWDNMPDFRARAAKLAQDADTLLAAMPADPAAVGKAVQTLGANCGGCHEQYRIKKQ